MKIVYSIFGIDNPGGMERIVLAKASALVQRGYEVHIIITTKLRKPFFYFDERICFHEIGLENDYVSKTSLALFLERMEALLLEIKPDIAISTEHGHSKYLYQVNDGSKKIIEIHFSKYKRKNTLAKIDKYWWGRLIANLFTYKKIRHIKHYDKFVVLTDEDKKHWYGLDNITVIHNMIPTIDEPLDIDYSSKQIIGVGRFTGQKGWEFMIRIWAQLADRYPDWRVVIYGTGHKKHMLQKLIHKYELEQSFFLEPPVKNMFEEYAKSSIFVSTSRYEGQPMVLLEAMCCGLPPVSFAYQCGPRDIITNGVNGYVTNLYDISSFADNLSMLMDDKQLRQTIGQQARQSVRPFSNRAIMDQWEDLFQSLCQ